MGEFDEAGCLADAAAVLAARQRVDALLCRLILQAFDVDAVDQLRRWIDEELNRPGSGGGTEATGEWFDASTEEVSERVA